MTTTRALVLCFALAGSASAGASPVSEWNEIALRVTAAAPWNPLRESRAMAMVSWAVADAVRDCGARASVDAAVAAAAHDVLVALYPDARGGVDVAERAVLAALPPGAPKDAGISAGRAAAARVVALRRDDGSAEKPPEPSPELEPGWGRVTPFLVESVARFRPRPPPSPASGVFRRDLDEVRAVGERGSRARDAGQTSAARRWAVTATQLWNQVARQLVSARRLEPAEAARAFALLNMTGADALIAAWDAKFTFRQKRPIAVLRAAGDAAWTPLLPTPPFPDYPCGHTAYAGAAEIALGSVFGAAPIEIALDARRYRSLDEIAAEVVDARVWAGVHWRTSCTAGRELGRAIARAALVSRAAARASAAPP